MDDLDGLLEDLPDDNARAKSKPRAAAKRPVAAEDEWGDLGFDDPPAYKKAGTSVKSGLGTREGSGKSSQAAGARQRGFGFGGPDGLKKEPKKAAEDDDDWGDLGDNKSGGRLLGRKPKKEEDDDFENLLDGMVGAKGGQKEEAQAQRARPRTAAAKNTAAWGAGDADELEDMEDAGSQAPSGNGSQRGASDEAVAARRRALFGGGVSGSQADAPRPARRAQTATRPAPAQPEKPATPFAPEQPALGDGNASIGSQGSGIELLEVPNSRTRRMIRPPAAASASRPSLGLDASGASNPTTLRPPSGPDSGVNQIQELHQNNRLVRPDTGNVRKPPRAGGFDAAGEDAATLDLLAESQHAQSNAGSHVSGTAAGASATAHTRLGSQGGRRDNLGATASHADFDRAEEDLDLDAELGDGGEYESPDGEGGSDSDGGGGGYQPTLIAKSAQARPKKKKKKKAQGAQGSPGKAQGAAMGNLDLTGSAGKAYTVGSGGSAAAGQDGSWVRGRPPAPAPHAVGSSPDLASRDFGRPKIRPTDPKGALEYDIELERDKIAQMEQRCRTELEQVRLEHAAAVAEVEAKHAAQKNQHEDESRKLQADKNAAIEEAKKKLAQLHKIDLDGRDLLYNKDLANQRALFEDQQQNLRRQLQERREIKDLAKEINDSSGSINTLVAQIGTANQGELQRREAEIARREKILAEKRQTVAEKRRALESRREKLRQEFDEIKQRENETRLDYQRAKADIAAELDRFELEHLQEKRLVKDKIVEAEVEARRVQLECEKVSTQIDKALEEHKSKLDEWEIEKERIRQAHANFKVESAAQQMELTEKLRAVQDAMKEQNKEEQEFDQRQAEFDDEHNKVVAENDALQEELDKYCIEKDTFDRQAQQVKEKGERDQIESEQIGYFKVHKERLYEQLKQRKQDLEVEKQQLSEETVKHQIFKDQISTKQKTLEGLRYSYIKGDQQETVQRAEFIASAKNRFVPINPPVAAAAPSSSAAAHLAGANAQASASGAPGSTVPRFSYEDYMKSLNQRMVGAAPQSSSQGGANFQAYLMREREDYLKSVHQFEKDTPLIHSLARLRERGGYASRAGEYSSPTGDAMLGARPLQTESVNSLHYMSAGLSER